MSLAVIRETGMQFVSQLSHSITSNLMKMPFQVAQAGSFRCDEPTKPRPARALAFGCSRESGTVTDSLTCAFLSSLSPSRQQGTNEKWHSIVYHVSRCFFACLIPMSPMSADVYVVLSVVNVKKKPARSALFR